MNDIIPPHKRRSIRDIPIPEKAEEKPDVVTEDRRTHHDNKKYHDENSSQDDVVIEKNIKEDEKDEIEDARPQLRRATSRKKQDSFYVAKNNTPKKLILSAVLVAILGFFIVLAFRNGAEVVVDPKIAEATIAAELQAFPTTAENADMTFTTQIVAVEVSETIRATGEEAVSEAASGQITIYNEFSDEPQRLIAQTRFESPEGNIYRIQESVTVPGQTATGPGAITVTVAADEVGESYNIEKTTFTIPGFAGQPQFDSMYAKSESAMTGGYDGVRKFVEAEEKTALEAALTEQATIALTQKVATVDVANYVFSTSSLQSFNLTQSDNGDDVTFTMTAEATVVLLEKDMLANAIASVSLTTFDAEKEQVAILPGKDFMLDIVPIIASGSNNEITAVTVAAEGSVTFLWQVDTTALTTTLAGTERKTLRNILELVPSVQKAEVTIRPFWKNSFPENSDKITIIVKDIDA